MKRAEPEDSDIDVSSTESESEQVEETVDVDFDYFDLNPSVDFHATKTFLTQLLGDDAGEFNISELADLILQENSVGTTIKTDGQESDPFAILLVININDNLNRPAIKTLVDYVVKKTAADREFSLMLTKLLPRGQAQPLKVGLIFSERMINMPVEVVPPMYKMLLEEMTKAHDARDKYEFDYFLVISKVYHLVAANEREAKPKKKKTDAAQPVEKDYFHYEDLVLEANCAYKGTYDYTSKKQETDSRRVFSEYGIDPKLSLILLDKESLARSVPQMEAKFPPF
jgi:protein BCP1